MSALKYIRPASHHWRPEVKLCSSLEGDGVDQVWEVMAEFRRKMEESGELEARRRRQHLRWMWSYVEERLVRMARDIGHHSNIDNLENMVSHSGFRSGTLKSQHDQTEGSIMVLLWCPRSPLFTSNGGHYVGPEQNGHQWNVSLNTRGSGS